MTYDPQIVAQFFDSYGDREWNRLVATPAAEINLHLHALLLRRLVPRGSRVLEIGAGAGRFTQVLASLGARVTVADISPGQVALNRQYGAQFGFDSAVEAWDVADITDLSRYPDGSFERVVAYGGPFSYVLDRRDTALAECRRVLQPGGLLLASVMSLWGSAHNALPGVLDMPPEYNQRITATGDLTPETFPGRAQNFMHMFRADEVRAWLEGHGLRLLAMSASGVLCPAWGDALVPIRADAGKWAELLRMEEEASTAPGSLDMGTHIIFACSARKRSKFATDTPEVSEYI